MKIAKIRADETPLFPRETYKRVPNNSVGSLNDEEPSTMPFPGAADWDHRWLIGDGDCNAASSPTSRDLGREIKEMRLTWSASYDPPEIPRSDGIDGKLRWSSTHTLRKLVGNSEE